MAKIAAATTTLNIRMMPALRRALDQAARAEDRPPSALARKILADWLKRRAERP